LVNGRIHLAGVIEDAPSLRLFTGLDEGGQRQHRQQTDNGDNDHDFDESKRRCLAVIVLGH
jgi:hypothetical protein